MKTQIGELVTANFEDRTLTFEMGEDAVVKSGEYAIVPIEEYKKMRHVQPGSLDLNGSLRESNADRIESIEPVKSVIAKWLEYNSIFVKCGELERITKEVMGIKNK